MFCVVRLQILITYKVCGFQCVWEGFCDVFSYGCLSQYNSLVQGWETSPVCILNQGSILCQNFLYLFNITVLYGLVQLLYLGLKKRFNTGIKILQTKNVMVYFFAGTKCYGLNLSGIQWDDLLQKLDFKASLNCAFQNSMHL